MIWVLFGEILFKGHLERRPEGPSKFEGYVKDKEKISDIKMSWYHQQHRFFMSSNSPTLLQISEYLQFVGIL